MAMDGQVGGSRGQTRVECCILQVAAAVDAAGSFCEVEDIPCPPPEYCETLTYCWLRGDREATLSNCTSRAKAPPFATRLVRSPPPKRGAFVSPPL